MITCEVLTPWAGDGSRANPFHPQLIDDYPGTAYTDATDQPTSELPPTPNLYSVIAVMADASFTALQTNATYQVLWYEQS